MFLWGRRFRAVTMGLLPTTVIAPDRFRGAWLRPCRRASARRGCPLRLPVSVLRFCFSKVPPSFRSASSATNQPRIVQNLISFFASRRRPEGQRQGESPDPTLDWRTAGIEWCQYALSGAALQRVSGKKSASRRPLAVSRSSNALIQTVHPSFPGKAAWHSS
jgi:hypothetical protein